MKLQSLLLLLFIILFITAIVNSQQQQQQCKTQLYPTQLFFLSNVLWGIFPMSGIISGESCYTSENSIQTYIFPNGALNTIPAALFNKPFKGQVVYQDFKRVGIESNFTSTEIILNNGVYTIKIIGANK